MSAVSLTIGPKGNGVSAPNASVETKVGGADPILDPWTLKDQQQKKEQWGATSTPIEHARYCVTVHQFHNGTGSPRIEATVCYMKDGWVKGNKKKLKEVEEQEEQRKQSPEDLIRSARRANKAIRHYCIAMQASNMITCTTKEAIVDRDEFALLVQSFFKKIRAKWPDFQYVGVFERHDSLQTSDAKRHSLHLHFCIAGWMDYNVVRDMWRATVAKLRGTEYIDANIDGAVKSRTLVNPEVRQRQIARYLAKYVSKEVESGEPCRKRYWASRNIQRPKAERFYLATAPHPGPFFRAVLEDIYGCQIDTIWSPDIQPGTMVPMFYFSTA